MHSIYTCSTHRQRQRQRQRHSTYRSKSKLQALCQQRGWEFPTYQVTKQGHDHNPLFYATVTVSSFSTSSSSSSSKKSQSEPLNSPLTTSPSPPPPFLLVFRVEALG
ncbi:hypothetical protein OIU77_015228 [Salix suchowensis]|uniref:DRBM domain-containing protein n=1 Tax=Salix suchowensis TaxID=1278906 RepID=A0ABQ8ZSC1_9ROSI|nr:hypothetical protein OIU77_015228 [Salix suchowensis]